MVRHDEVRSVAFTPDGDFLAAGEGEGIARLWDPDTGAEATAAE